MYDGLYRTLDALMGGERSPLPNSANMSALIYGALDRLNWVGFYWLVGDELVLGSFQGKPACIRINVSRGVCGAAVRARASVLVPDVRRFPGHIACDAASLSELVVPLVRNGRVLGVLDMDSDVTDRFTDEDRAGMERLCALFCERCDWSGGLLGGFTCD